MSPASIGGGFWLGMTGGEHISRLVETLWVDFLQKAQKIFQLNLVINIVSLVAHIYFLFVTDSKFSLSNIWLIVPPVVFIEFVFLFFWMKLGIIVSKAVSESLYLFAFKYESKSSSPNFIITLLNSLIIMYNYM